MKLETPKTTAICAFIAVGCFTIAGAFKALTANQSTTASADRRAKLDQVAKYEINENCWEPKGGGDLTIGQTFKVTHGKLPTVCVFNGYQYAYVAYLGGNLQVMYVYTPDEVKKQISVINKERS